MARQKKSRATEERKSRTRGRRERARPAAREPEPAMEEGLLEAEVSEMPEAVPTALLIFTAVFLLGATLLNLIHLGTAYGVGPFK